MTIPALGQTTNSLNEYLTRTAGISDKEIVRQAYAEGNKVAKKSFSNKLLKALPALAVGGVALVNGIVTKGKLSSKTKSALYTVGTFAIVSAVYDSVHDGIKKLKERDENLKQADNKHPVIGAFAKLGIAFGASNVVLKGIGRGIRKIAEKFPNFADGCKKMSKTVSDVIDKTKLSAATDKFMGHLGNFAKKHPDLTSFAKRNSFLLMIGGYIGLSTLLIAQNEKNRQKAMANKANKLNTQRKQAQDIISRVQDLNTSSL